MTHFFFVYCTKLPTHIVLCHVYPLFLSHRELSKARFSTDTSFKGQCPSKKKHSPSTWGHDFQSSDPKIVGQEGKPCQIGQWSYESCQFSCEFFSCKGSITWVFPKYLTQLIPSIFYAFNIISYPTGQGMRWHSNHYQIRGDRNEAQLKNVCLI